MSNYFKITRRSKHRRTTADNPLYAPLLLARDYEANRKKDGGYNSKAEAIRKMYYSKWWRKARAQKLREEPHCAMCAYKGDLTPAVVVDHVKPHRGLPALFFDYSNLQSLCKHHHDSVKAKAEAERRGGADLDGNPYRPAPGW